MSEKYHIEVQVEEHVGPVDTQSIDDAVRLTLLHQRVEDASEVVIVISDDDALEDLNRRFRGVARPTDVLSFAQEMAGTFHGARVLGDIVISLETVERYCAGDRTAMRGEVRLLFCHGMLHLLGYTHETPVGQREMNEKQAQYLGLSTQAAWHLGR